jgi:hypothetical protein
MIFPEYLKAAIEMAVSDEAIEADNGELQCIHKRCRSGVRNNHENLNSTTFMKEYLWCVGSIQKPYDRRLKYKYWDKQLTLFRQCDALRIISEAIAIRKEWENSHCDLKKEMVDSVMFAAALIVAEGWEVFRKKYLLLPKEPEAETATAWGDAYWLLDQFPLVGDAIVWYLIRNLYGGPFFKPDVHIRAIAEHFFSSVDSPVEALAIAVRQEWPKACPDLRFQPVHLGEADYMLWWYRRKTGIPV